MNLSQWKLHFYWNWNLNKIRAGKRPVYVMLLLKGFYCTEFCLFIKSFILSVVCLDQMMVSLFRSCETFCRYVWFLYFIFWNQCHNRVNFSFFLCAGLQHPSLYRTLQNDIRVLGIFGFEISFSISEVTRCSVYLTATCHCCKYIQLMNWKVGH